ncbi:MAG: helix-turn-helix domain-containing protein [Chloroflexota bacterium]|nr:helix-turn-helix domain-containing protein [Chloroflexota bacterium]
MIGDWIKVERKRRGWTQAVLAQRAAVTQQAIYLLESGKRTNPGAHTLTQLARAFEVSLDELMQLTTDSVPLDAPPGSRLDDWVQAMVRIGPTLTPAERVAVLQHAQALQERRGR